MGALAAGLAAGGSILGGITGGKGAEAAAKAQAQSQQAAINEQAREFNVGQANEAPFTSAGTSSLEQMLRLLGLGDSNTGKNIPGITSYSAADQQAGALAALKASPEFTVPYQTGVDTLLQNASATGGLRGGNTENSLATFGGNLFNSVLSDQLTRLGNLASLGQSSAASQASQGQAYANSVSQLLSSQGNSNAVAAASPYLATGNTLDQLGTIAGNYFGGGLLGTSNNAYGIRGSSGIY